MGSMNLKMRLGMWLLQPPKIKKVKIKKDTMCYICKTRHAETYSEFYLQGLPICNQCASEQRRMNNAIERMTKEIRKELVQNY